jgi:hypothetical protein
LILVLGQEHFETSPKLLSSTSFALRHLQSFFCYRFYFFSRHTYLIQQLRYNCTLWDLHIIH